MLIIILNHIGQHGIWFSPDAPVTANYILSKCICGWTGTLGNYLFIFVSGYFISRSEFSARKLFRIWFQVFSISAIIGCILFFTKTPVAGFDYSAVGFEKSASPMTVKDLITSFLPTLFANNWFAASYILFYLFTPFLNLSLKVLDQKKHRDLIVLMAVCSTVIYMIPSQRFFTKSDLFLFIMSYYIVNYIRIYKPKILDNQKLNIAVCSAMALLFIIWEIVIINLKDRVAYISSHFSDVLSYPFTMSRFTSLIFAIFAFAIFRNLNIDENKIINKIAGTTFGIYLIHDNPWLRGILWHKIFGMDRMADSGLLVFYILFAVAATFAVCAALDLVRQYLLERPALKLYDRIFQKKQERS